MKNLVAVVTFLAVGSVAAGAFGQPYTVSEPPVLQGSDTLEAFTRALVDGSCADALAGGFQYPLSPPLFEPTQLNFIGGGSTNGQTNMQTANVPTAGQYVAPMSRALNNSNNACSGNNMAEGIAFAADALAVLVDSGSSQGCGGGHPARAESSGRPTTEMDTSADDVFSDLRYSGTVAGASFTDWRHVLRLVYLGIPPNIAPSAPDASELAARDCNSTLRRDFTANYENVFQDGCAGGSACATKPLKHAFRLGDTSGTTDMFLNFLSAPAVQSTSGAQQRPFCNGLEGEDLDPIRRSCTQDEQVCEANGTLGLVLPIVVPTLRNVQQGDQNRILYNANPADGAAAIT
ncbi:MAG: hypothetical protein RL701_7554, partial [Pseudomonadota bacterium]